MRDRAQRQEGQAAVLALVALLFGAVLVAGVAHLGATVASRARVQAAADATALAGAAAGPGEAARIAAANHAQVVAYVDLGTEVEVTVARGPVRATARARWHPGAIP